MHLLKTLNNNMHQTSYIKIFLAGLAVVGKIALRTMHPLMFAFLREVIAGPSLVLLGWILESKFLKKELILKKNVASSLIFTVRE